ncbi:uncharacterized protein [Antedon mediterranea]|uniref:uncharacterized protein n=1 Tax=Antedon mediterranea TaxID=105859 RepID=UPI003AF50E52
MTDKIKMSTINTSSEEKKPVVVSDDDDQIDAHISRNVDSGVFSQDSMADRGLDSMQQDGKQKETVMNEKKCERFPVPHSHDEASGGVLTEELVVSTDTGVFSYASTDNNKILADSAKSSEAASIEPSETNIATPEMIDQPRELKTTGCAYPVKFPGLRTESQNDGMNQYLENAEQKKKSTSTPEKVDLHDVNRLCMVKEPTTSPTTISDEETENMHMPTGMEKCIQPISAVQTQMSETKPEKDGQNTTCISEGIRNITEPRSMVQNLFAAEAEYIEPMPVVQNLVAAEAENTEQLQLDESEIEIRLELIELLDQFQRMLDSRWPEEEEAQQLQDHTIESPTSFTSRRRGTGMTEAAIDQLLSLTDRQDASFGQVSCTICFDELQPQLEDVRMLPCRHAFHFECIKRWLEKHIRCPNCQGVSYS